MSVSVTYLLSNSKRTKPTFSKTINHFMSFSSSLSLEIAEFNDLKKKKVVLGKRENI